MRPEHLRRQFPVFENVAFFGAGTCGPLPAQALRAGADVALAAAERGRGHAYYQEIVRLMGALRARYGTVLGVEASELSLTLSTSDGIARVLNSLELPPGSEVLTAPDEHPGLLGPLASLARERGVVVRAVPLASIAEAVTGDTRLVACSHVSWVDGALAPSLAEVGRSVPVLLDGAQGVGAVPVDLRALGCAAYAGSGQKWLCGPAGTGMLWIAPEWRDRIPPLTTGYTNLSEPNAGLDAVPFTDGRAYDAPSFASQTLAAAEAACGVLEEFGWEAVWERAASLADALAAALAERGRTVQRPSRSTLVSWEEDASEDVVGALEAAGVVVRFLPGTRLVRASVGAWNDESDLERLLSALS